MKNRFFTSLLILGVVILIFIFAGLKYMTNMPDHSYSGPFQPLSSNEKFLKDELQNHVLMLSNNIGERNIWHYDQLVTSANYIESVFKDLGYNVTKQEYRINNVTIWNLAAEIVGTSKPKEIILIGAHYDSVNGSPGANDNASGVAALLEIARLLKDSAYSRTIRFVAFVNEEPPFFQTNDMGSRVYSSQVKQKKEKIIAMLSLETIGYYSDQIGSQQYPFPFSLFYPKTGNFLAFVGNISSRLLVHRAIDIFRRNISFPSEGISAPGWITGIDWSDHWSFWQEGYQAIMITDTALFRYKYYHSAQDTYEKLNYTHIARAVMGIAQVVRDLSETGMK
ncbi:MAG: M28 family peptidase [Nitrospirota bacterium]